MTGVQTCALPIFNFIAAKGGRLIYLCGQDTIGEKNLLPGSVLEGYLPIISCSAKLTKAKDPRIRMTAQDKKIKGVSWGKNAAAFYYQKVTPSKRANVLARVDGHPLLLKAKVGKGEVIFFAGTTLGYSEKGEKQKPFWETREWQKTLKALFRYLNKKK